MELIGDFHSHSKLSDGKGTVEENVHAAHARGLTWLAVTEHGPGHLVHGMPMKELPALRRRVDRLNAQYAGEITVLLGVEANLLSLWGDIDIRPEDRELFDLVVMGFHKSGRMSRPADYWHFYCKRVLPLPAKAAQRRRQQTALAYCRALAHHRIDILAHPGHNMAVEFAPVFEACAISGTAIEISSRRGHLLFDARQTRQAQQMGACFAIDSDGHSPHEIAEFDQGMALAGEAGLSNTDVVNARGYRGAWLERLEV